MLDRFGVPWTGCAQPHCCFMLWCGERLRDSSVGVLIPQWVCVQVLKRLLKYNGITILLAALAKFTENAWHRRCKILLQESKSITT